MRKAVDTFYRLCMVIAAVAMVSILVAVTAQIVGRLIGVLVPSAPEIAGFSMAASSFMALAYTLREGGHVRVSLLILNLSSRVQRIVEGAVLVFALCVTIFFTFYVIRLAVMSSIYGDVSAGVLPIPLWIPQGFVAFGLFALAVALADELFAVLRGRLPRYAEVGEHGSAGVTQPVTGMSEGAHGT